MYKASTFNVIYRDDRKVLLFNSLTKKYLKSEHNSQLVANILEDPNRHVDSPIFLWLKNHGMIVENSFDEFSSLTFLRNEYIYNPQLHICILPTEQCNLRCTYCYENFKNGEMSFETQNAFIIWLKRNIRKYTSVHIDWFGGEPLVAKEIIFSLSEQVIEICHLARKPFTASVTTNGTLLSYDVFKKLLKCHVTSIQVTIDGVQETHDTLKIRADGKGTYDTIIQNLLSIKKNVKASASFKITIRTNITKDVVQRLPLHLSKLMQMFGDDKRFTFYFRPVGHWAEHKEFTFEDSLVGEFETMYQPIIEAQVPLNYVIYGSMLEDQICSAAKRNYFVLRSDGTINKCTMLLENDENFIGKLCEDGTMLIDPQKSIKWMRITSLPSSCQQCEFAPSCFGLSCPAKGFLLANSCSCGYEARSIPYIMQLLDQCNIFECYEAINRGVECDFNRKTFTVL